MNSPFIAQVRVGDRPEPVSVRPSSPDKPDIPPELRVKWQQITDIAAKILHVPAAMVRRLQAEHFDIFISSDTLQNPFPAGTRQELGVGSYCETVVAKRDMLLIPNALIEGNWEGAASPMIAYVGYPLMWPDGEVFGTICALDNKENHFSELYLELLSHFREVIELDLRLLLQRKHLQELNVRKELQIREIHHRIKNNFSLLLGTIQLEMGFADEERGLILDIESRIRAISALHESIYRSEDVTELGLATYARELVESVLGNYAPQPVRLDLAIGSMILDLDQLTMIGLLLNELTTNAIKYAFEFTPEPCLIIRAERTGDRLHLSVADNGPGLPTDFSPSLSESLGMTIISGTVQQMGGTWSIESTQGACFIFDLDLSR